MFETFYEMENSPFTRNVPVKALYESAAMSETVGRIMYAADKQLLVVVTSDSGCGKTTVIRRVSEELSDDEYVILYLSDSKLTPRWFYKGLLDQLGIESRFYRGDAKHQL